MPRAIQNWIGGATASTQIWCPGTSMHDAKQFDEIRQQSTRLSEFRRERRLWPTHSPKDPKDGGHHPMEAVQCRTIWYALV